MKRLFLLSYFRNYTAVGLLIKPSTRAIMAITNNTCIMPVAEYKNTPNAHPMSKITAMIYNSEFIVNLFN